MISRKIEMGRVIGMQIDVEKKRTMRISMMHTIKDSGRSITTGECGIFNLCWY
jgi:hypothetical protein